MSEAKNDAPPPKKGKRGTILILLGGVVLLGGGGAGWYLLKPHGGEAAEVQYDSRKRIYSNLEPFTVNLADEGSDRFVQVSIVLEIADQKVAPELSAHMPAIRNAVLMLLSSKQSKELLTVAGKQQLADEIAVAVGTRLGWESDEPPRARKTSTGGGDQNKADHADDDEEAKPARRGKTRRAGPPNPVQAVHFVQFIVQ